MRNFPETEEDFKLTTQEEFMETLRGILVESRKYLEGKIDLNNFRLMLVLPPNYITPIKNLCPKEALVIIHDMFVGLFVDDQLIMINENINADAPTFYAIQAPVDCPGLHHTKTDHTVTINFSVS